VRLIPFGEIVTTHGLDGWLKLNPFNPETTALSSIDKIYIEEGGQSSLPKLDQGEFYLYQAVGLEVVDCAGTRVGIVTRIWATTGGKFYVVQNGNKELFIPAVKEIVDKVDFAAGKMIINPPEGLLDL
jgi:16S rRNA processing protein RimM